MYIPFQEMPNQARIWVYQASRSLQASEIDQITQTITEACQAWEAHGAPLQASFEIRHKQVIIVAVNEAMNAASGCSIDASTRWFKTLGESFQVDFFNRDLAVVRNEQVTLIGLGQLKSSIEAGNLHPADQIITPLLQTLKQYREAWTCKAADSYLKRYF
ncbi:hypothetical protein [Aquirufa sp.]|jgi:hypothetical protein|uniref:hypothetical protein n=1 Tax=Aquirufa sp. TaxID=2676249 RepID=UPI0037BEA539